MSFGQRWIEGELKGAEEWKSGVERVSRELLVVLGAVLSATSTYALNQSIEGVCPSCTGFTAEKVEVKRSRLFESTSTAFHHYGAENTVSAVRVLKLSASTNEKVIGAARTFTNTSHRSRSVPSFTPTSSPELDELFLNFREQVFTPFALAQHHRDLIYKKSRHPLLLNDPGVTVTLSNDEDIRLMPMEPRERPNKRKSLGRVARLLTEIKDAEAWTNLPALMEGIEMAKEQMPPHWMESIARKANIAGKTGVIKLCAEMVKKTGATLANEAMTHELMLGFHSQAAKGRFEGEAVEKALRSAEQVSLMMEDKLHCAGKLKEGQKDMRKDPTVLGILLELAASKAVNVDNGEDINGKVAALVVKTLACTSPETWALPESQAKETQTARQLTRWIPLWNGTKTALKVNGIAVGPNSAELRLKCDKLEEAISTAEQKITMWWKKDSKLRPMQMLDEIR